MKLNLSSYIHHRDPFLFLDNVIHLNAQSIIAELFIKPDLALFQGHFPGDPIFPGVLIIEALSQAACVLAMNHLTPDLRSKYNTILTNIDKTSFHNMVKPGNTLILSANIIKIRDKLIMFNCIAYLKTNNEPINPSQITTNTLVSKSQITAILKPKL